MDDIIIRIPRKAVLVAVACVCILIVLLLVIQLASAGVFRPHYELQMFASKVNGLSRGDNVLLNGMRVGNVSRVEFQEHPSDADHNFRITVRIEKRYQDAIRSDATARVVRMGIGAERYVVIQASRTGEPIPGGGELRLSPTYELTPMEVLEFLAKHSNCKDEDKALSDNKMRPTN